MPKPEENAYPAPEEIDPMKKSDLGQEGADHPPLPYSGPVGGMGADAESAIPPVGTDRAQDEAGQD